MSERPFGPLSINALGDVRIPEHIRSVVDVNELVSECLTENDPDKRNQSDANPDNLRDEDRAISHGGIDKIVSAIGQKK